MLRAAGSVAAAAAALRRARHKACGNALSGVQDVSVARWLDPLHSEYLCEVAGNGVPARRTTKRFKLTTTSHKSATDHLEEMYSKAWKDTRYGVVIWCSEAVEDLLGTLVESPLGRVPKMLPDRTLSKEGRPIHDMRLANAYSPKELHPPALQPRHRQLARISTYLKVRYPGVRQLCAKRDVNRAFKWVWIHDEDVEEFGASLPGEKVGLEGRVIMIHCVMVFGWSGAPGEYI